MWRILSLKVVILMALYFSECSSKKADEKVYTPFFLQDRSDKSCLGQKGFTFCNENALWLLVDRPETKKYSLVPFLSPTESGMCLEAVNKFFRKKMLKMGSCKRQGSKEWTYKFLNKSDINLISSDVSIGRGDPYQNSMFLISKDSSGVVPLYYYPTNIHEAGFYLKASSDGHCFDGNKFRICDVAKEVLFGVGISFSWRGIGSRYFFNYGDKSKCLTQKHNRVRMGSCNDKTALSWGLQSGQLTYDNGKMCLVRTQDHFGELAPCNVGSEFIGLEIPTLHTTEDIRKALKNDNLSSQERDALKSILDEVEGKTSTPRY